MKVRSPHILRTVRNIAAGIVVILLIVIAAGAAYIWYTGRNGPADTTAVAPQSDAITQPIIKPVKPSAKNPVGVAVEDLTSPVHPGMMATIAIKTTPYATCSIKVEYNKIASKDPGLHSKKADDFGMQSWNFKVDETAPKGSWPVTVTCQYDKKSGMVVDNLIVK